MVQAQMQSPDASAGIDRSMLSYLPVEVSTDLTNLPPAAPRIHTPVAHARLGKDSIKIDMEIRLPPKQKPEKKKPPPAPEPKPVSSLLSLIIQEQRFVEPQYFQNVDCVGVPEFFSAAQCRKIIDFAESQGFCLQRPHRLLNIQWTDLVDPIFAEQIWRLCGLERFLSGIVVDGMVPCGVNDVVRIQKYEAGSVFGKHTDQCIERQNGCVSKYSLRVFLNSRDEFAGGLSAFHVPHRAEPVVFEPETGLALIYPQGALCTVQEEQEVLEGQKYVLRADILFKRPGRS